MAMTPLHARMTRMCPSRRHAVAAPQHEENDYKQQGAYDGDHRSVARCEVHTDVPHGLAQRSPITIPAERLVALDRAVDSHAHCVRQHECRPEDRLVVAAKGGVVAFL
eukprot:scaffold97077_cov61-Phaeocystis_antarctica.AAC.1